MRFIIVIFASLLIFSGCTSSSKLVLKDQLKDTPKPSQSNMTKAAQCVGEKLESSKANQAFVFLVRDLNDGTVREGPYQNSALSDAGRIQLMNVLSTHTYPHIGLVTDTYPLIFKQIVKESVGLNRLGLPSQKNMLAFNNTFGSIINASRQAKKLPVINNIIPLVVSGSFTRFDSDSLAQAGWGQNAGSRANGDGDDWSRGSGEVSRGKTSSARAMSLVVNLVDPRSNLIVGSQSFDLIFYRKNKSFRLRFALGDGFFGFSNNDVEVEGVHSAQKTLIDAAALWIMNKAYGRGTSLKGCFNEDQKLLIN